uniref:Uncharacterized protein n=1 Tax=Lacunastrum gracillimum TaxID=427913 RepID=A0A2U8GHZ1_9CHLO|nr:hypothetical protein [Lacunastrum gracillimum]AWI68071.1 hypothetical protein [Lacunastrum gracillimum]
MNFFFLISFKGSVFTENYFYKWFFIFFDSKEFLILLVFVFAGCFFLIFYSLLLLKYRILFQNKLLSLLRFGVLRFFASSRFFVCFVRFTSWLRCALSANN